jgi:hypothetical protein
LAVTSANVIHGSSITASLEGRALDSNGIVGDVEPSMTLRSAIDAIVLAARDAHALGTRAWGSTADNPPA